MPRPVKRAPAPPIAALDYQAACLPAPNERDGEKNENPHGNGELDAFGVSSADISLLRGRRRQRCTQDIRPRNAPHAENAKGDDRHSAAGAGQPRRPIKTSSTPSTASPVPGANSFTEDHAKARIESAGYSNVADLKITKVSGAVRPPPRTGNPQSWLTTLPIGWRTL